MKIQKNMNQTYIQAYQNKKLQPVKKEKIPQIQSNPCDGNKDAEKKLKKEKKQKRGDDLKFKTTGMAVTKAAAESLEGGEEIVAAASIVADAAHDVMRPYRYMKTVRKQAVKRKQEKKHQVSKKEGAMKRSQKAKLKEKKANDYYKNKSRIQTKSRVIKYVASNLSQQEGKRETLTGLVVGIVKDIVKATVKAFIKKYGIYMIGAVIGGIVQIASMFLMMVLIYQSPIGILLTFGEKDSAQEVLSEYEQSFDMAIERECEEMSNTSVIYRGMESDGTHSNYNDVLVTYAVKHNYGDMGLVMDDVNRKKLKKLFDAMCFYEVDYQYEPAPEPETVEGDEPESVEVEKVCTGKIVYVTKKTYSELIGEGFFSEEEIPFVYELIESEYFIQATSQTYGLSEQEKLQINSSLKPGETGSMAVKIAMEKVGAIYSQARRYEEGYYDCSSLTYRVYQKLWIDLNYQGTNVASYQARKMVEENRVIAYEDLAPGDLIFWANEPSDTFLSITHVGLYAGNGKTIEASYSKGRVVYRDIWGVDEIVLCARPY